MKDIKQQYEVKIVRYNFGDSFSSYRKEFDNLPTELEIKEFLLECNNAYPQVKDFNTKIFITPYYQVINI